MFLVFDWEWYEEQEILIPFLLLLLFQIIVAIFVEEESNRKIPKNKLLREG